jgi:hypothetical protein
VTSTPSVPAAAPQRPSPVGLPVYDESIGSIYQIAGVELGGDDTVRLVFVAPEATKWLVRCGRGRRRRHRGSTRGRATVVLLYPVATAIREGGSSSPRRAIVYFLSGCAAARR